MGSGRKGSGRKFLPLYIGIMIAGIAIVSLQRALHRQEPSAPSAPEIEVSGPVVVPPRLNEQQKLGALAFAQACSDCHGLTLTGRATGPSLLVDRYRVMPDDDYRRAVERGAEATQGGWLPMPPIQGLSPGQVDAIIAYVRRMQAVNPNPSLQQ
ncbi:cytochrome c oxidase, cbb3-type, subunit III [Hartmannibacter diazotrophicus]|uniref:Cytochrome c oxidase, cbb3-type, subunit III n=1 Tax=Hartmannibacter diazotrophicus TaxID=1482074 RepID=A0A2C9D8N1_9HYPH|nr:cytochrome c [Hartmannibacter diazotrophicus]SON56101.1 cytochrome c oxidase, cbb3-type, subunit III [Hartmannibacter diazotrophicus]